MKINPIKTKLNQLCYRLKVAWKIIVNPNLHWVFISLTNEEFLNYLKNDDIDISFSYHKLQEYNAWDIIKKVAECKDDVDMILGKAQFQAEAEEHYKSKNK